MTDFQQALTKTVPLDNLKARNLTKNDWAGWVQQIEYLLRKQGEEFCVPLFNLILPLPEGRYLRILCNGWQVEGIVLYEQATSYRVSATRDHNLITTATHDIYQINGLYPTHISMAQKQTLHGISL